MHYLTKESFPKVFDNSIQGISFYKPYESITVLLSVMSVKSLYDSSIKTSFVTKGKKKKKTHKVPRSTLCIIR